MHDTIEQHYKELSCLGGPQTPIRVAVLEELNSNGSLRKSELEDIFVRGSENGKWEFKVSKPTLHRQFEEGEENANVSLVENGWVKDVSESRGAESRYEVTPKGQMVCEKLASLLDLFGLLEEVPSELEPFLGVVTRAGVDISRDVLQDLADAEVHTKTPTGVSRTTTKALQFIHKGDYNRGISWIAGGEFVDYYHVWLEDENKEAELILSPEVLEELVENYAEKWRAMLETGNLTVFECEVFPLGLSIAEHGVAWGYFEPPHGDHKAVLLTESDTVREWALDVFKEYKQEGRDVTQEQMEKTRRGAADL